MAVRVRVRVRARLAGIVVAAMAAAVTLLAAAKENPANYPRWLPRLTELRRLDSKWSSESRWKSQRDCLAYTRHRVMRPYPGNCYTKGGHNYDYKEQWWKFWKENRGDITFTFDFVFMSKNKNVINQQFENQFWYNIAYLKQLRLSIPNPENIASRSKLEKEVTYEAKRKAAALDEMEKSAISNKRRMLDLKAKLHSIQNASPK